MEENTQTTGQEPNASAETVNNSAQDLNTSIETPTTQNDAQNAESSAEENPYLLPVEDEAQDEQQQTLAEPNEALKPYLEVSPYINSPEALRGAIADSHLLWDVVNGQVPAGAILQGLEQNNPQAWQNVVNGLAQYITEKTGFQFVDPQAIPQNAAEKDPVQARIDAIEQQFRQQQEEREQQILAQRAAQAQRTLLDHLAGALKGSFLEGEEGAVLSMLGAKLGDPVKVIEMIESGDLKAVDSALKAVKREEAERYNRYAKRIAAQRTKVVNAQPGVDNVNTPAKPRTQQKFDLSTREGRIAAINAAL